MKIPVPSPPFAQLWADTLANAERGPMLLGLFTDGLGPAPGGKYRHWDTFRHTPPRPGIPVEVQWLAVKMARSALHRPLPLKDARGHPFVFGVPPVVQEYLHRIDRDATGAIQGSPLVTDPSTRTTYLFKSLVEEAITSSQLEGASTTRRVAKAMIQEGRPPRDRGERMILNNYEALELVRAHRNEPLTPKLILELQARLTRDTLDDSSAAGRWREEADQIVVADDQTGQPLHTPPPATSIPARVEALCAFANGETGGEFIPPPIRAILLHFWLGYDHPFVDGNGRTARALFYWAMMRYGYWLCEYLSISRILKKARSAYSRAYLYSETDENDATYFVLYQLKVLCQAIADLHEFLQRKEAQLRETDALVRQAKGVRGVLNPRQLALVRHALRTPDAQYTLESHRRSHGIAFETARSDLAGLTAQKFLMVGKAGRKFVYSPVPNLAQRLDEKVRQAQRSR